MLEGKTANTIDLANLLPLKTERQDMREQSLRRLLKKRLVDSERLMAPFARRTLAKATNHGQTILLSLDQTDYGFLIQTGTTWVNAMSSKPFTIAGIFRSDTELVGVKSVIA